MDTTDITEKDFEVIQQFTQFPQSRRMRVVQVDGPDCRSAICEEFRFGSPFVLRPKRGKSLVKLMGVP